MLGSLAAPLMRSVYGPDVRTCGPKSAPEPFENTEKLIGDLFPGVVTCSRPLREVMRLRAYTNLAALQDGGAALNLELIRRIGSVIAKRGITSRVDAFPRHGELH